VGDGNFLWLECEPQIDEIKKDFDKIEIDKYNEIVFCGFGEPLERLDTLIETARYIKSKTDKIIRLNTNGLSDLIYNEPTAQKLQGVIDVVSISLNAPDSATYMQRCNPRFGEKSFDAILKFANDCTRYIKTVIFTVVDCIDDGEIEKCRKIAKESGVEFRVRKFQ
jgi:TatD family-associated radical SAM protein